METNHLLPYLYIPLATAIVLPFASKWRKKISDILTSITFLAGFANILFLFCSPSVIKDAYVSIPGDGLTIFFVGLIYLVAFCISIYSWGYLPKDMPNRSAYYSLILVSAAAMCGIIFADNFFSLYVYIEALAITSFALITTDSSSDKGHIDADKQKREGLEGALKYLLITFPASALCMTGISIVFLSCGSITFETLRVMSMSGESMGPATFGIALIILGFLIKSGVAPFHTWTPDAYQGAYPPISAYLGGIVTKISGVYAVLKTGTLINFYFGNAEGLSHGIMFIGMLSIAVGALAALRQKDFKRMLAFSSISQMGYIVLAAGLCTPIAVIGAVLHMFNHATFKTLLFLNSSNLQLATGTTEMDKMGGLEKQMPHTAWTTVVALLSTAGVPPLSGFWSKLLIIIALWDAGFTVYAMLALLFSTITLAYFIMMQRKVFFGESKASNENVKEVPFILRVPSYIMTFIIVAAGILFPFFYVYLRMTTGRILL